MKYPSMFLLVFLFLFSVAAGQENSPSKTDTTLNENPIIRIDRLENPNWRVEQMLRRNDALKGGVIVSDTAVAKNDCLHDMEHDCRYSCVFVWWKCGDSRKKTGIISWNGGHWSGFGIGYSGLIEHFGLFSLPEDARFLTQKPRSIAVMINIADFALLRGRTTALITGIGLEINNFRFEKNITLTEDNGRIVPDFSFDEAGIRLKKSKLTTAYINIPLLFEVQFGKEQRGFVNFGAIGGIRIGGHTKIKLNEPGFRSRQKQRNGLNLRNFHYGAAINGGYRNVALTMQYYPHSIFRRDAGPDVHQINIGVAILL